MLILRFVNVGNSRISARDSIVVLTHTAWAAIVTSALMVSYDLQIKTWHSCSRFIIFLWKVVMVILNFFFDCRVMAVG